MIGARYGYILSLLVRLVPDTHLADGKERVPLGDIARRAGSGVVLHEEVELAPGARGPALYP